MSLLFFFFFGSAVVFNHMLSGPMSSDPLRQAADFTGLHVV